MVTYEILIPAEEQDRDVFEERGEEGDCWGRVSGPEGSADTTGTFGPAGFFLGGVDVEGSHDVVALILVLEREDGVP